MKFIFKGYNDNLKKGRVDFNYELELPRKKLAFQESLFFLPPPGAQKIPQELTKNALDNISLMLGISYWKTYCPREMEIAHTNLSKEQAEFWNKVYTKGLGEFFYKNKINFKGLINFPHIKNGKTKRINFPVKNRSLLFLGGGRDSIVSSEILKKSGKEFSCFSVNRYSLQENVANIAGKKLMVMERKIDPKLLRLNRSGEVYNGHVPASAIYAFLGTLAAILYGYKNIISSNEKSADFGNVKYLGEYINHQWSKSQEFEKMFQKYLNKFITPSMKYYSLLRRKGELEIVKMFSRHKKYFQVFSSCNKNFTISRKPAKKWCGHCPKCAFVFGSLAAFVPKKEVIKIFGNNLFDDKALLPVYQELLGLRRFKPFECVGTPQEMRQAFAVVKRKGEFKDSTIIKNIYGV